MADERPNWDVGEEKGVNGVKQRFLLSASVTMIAIAAIALVIGSLVVGTIILALNSAAATSVLPLDTTVVITAITGIIGLGANALGREKPKSDS